MMMYIALLLGLLCANLPYIYFRWQRKKQVIHSYFWIWLLWVLNCPLIISLMLWFEKKETTLIHDKHWEFYALTLLMYLFFSYPSLMHALFRAKQKKIYKAR